MSDGQARRDRWARLVPAGYSAILALLITGPLLGSGYLLLRDAVSTPHSYLTDSALGLGDAAARAVPQDALIAALAPIVDGGLIVKAILLVALWAAGYGAAILARELLRVTTGPQLVAATVALWNPYVAERLLQGHWSLLAGYAALPWTALAAYRIRSATHLRRSRGTRRPADVELPTDRPEDDPPAYCDSARQGHHQGAAGTRRSTNALGRRYRQASGGGLTAVGRWGALAACLAAAGLTPTGALLAGCTALMLVGRRNMAGTVLLLLAASAPWLTATALSAAGSEPSDPAGIAAFAARAEPGLGTLGSLAGLGGIWNSDAVPNSRTTLLALVGTFLLVAVVATGLRAVVAGNASAGTHSITDCQRPGVQTRRRLLVSAAVAVALPALGATAWGMDVLEWLVTSVPGAGLLRDTQKYVALAMPAYALCAAAGCNAVAQLFASKDSAAADTALSQPHCQTADEMPRAAPSTTAATAPRTESASMSTVTRPPEGRATTAVISLTTTIFIALLTLPLFDLGWGVSGAVRPVHYPIGWQRVAERIDEPGDVAVLPGGMFRRFPYSGRAPVLDPAPRMLPHDVLQTGELPVHGGTVAGEGARARQVESLLLRGGPATDLAKLGVGWVLLERTTPGPLGESKNALAQLNPVYSDTDLALYRVPGAADRNTESHSTRRAISAAAHLLWAAILIGGLLLASWSPRTPRHR
ncbi:hypothetical protein [Nocardia sp. NPDC057440]|uniref:hypothetical protein n=1 Tax=Nocardia sp. NPDC057440 TaxID=3346134 RepID=UPI003671E557